MKVWVIGWRFAFDNQISWTRIANKNIREKIFIEAILLSCLKNIVAKD